MVVGPIVRAVGHRPPGYLCAFMLAAGYNLTMFAHELWVVYLTRGLMQGTCQGILLDEDFRQCQYQWLYVLLAVK